MLMLVSWLMAFGKRSSWLTCSRDFLFPLEADMSCLNEEAGNIPENIDSKTPKRSSWIDYNLRPGVDPTTVPFFIIGTHKHDKSCLPHVLVRLERMFHADMTNTACTDVFHYAFCFFSWHPRLLLS